MRRGPRRLAARARATPVLAPARAISARISHYWYLSRHEKLPEMSRGSLVGFVHDAEYRYVNQHQSQGGYGHCEWKQSARLLHRWDVISTSAASEPKRAALERTLHRNVQTGFLS